MADHKPGLANYFVGNLVVEQLFVVDMPVLELVENIADTLADEPVEELVQHVEIYSRLDAFVQLEPQVVAIDSLGAEVVLRTVVDNHFGISEVLEWVVVIVADCIVSLDSLLEQLHFHQ